jgi:hypothetical protein
VEKRQCERKVIEGQVAGKMILVDYLNILDLSIKGIRFQCSRRVHMNGIHRIRIESGGISLGIRGKVVRSTLCLQGREGVPVYEVAMTFANLTPEEGKSLKQLISLQVNG